jgi:CHASE3 domain sensor protein/putative methionine-R-sulfoxide reductase with GAF domain
MKMTLGRKIVLGFIACAFVLIGVAIFSFKNSEKFVVSNALVNNSNKVLYEFEQILMTSVDAETGVRGYVITGDDNFLKPFTTANTKAIEKLEKVKELTKDNPNQQNNIEELAKEIKMRFDNLNTCVNLRKKDFEKARVFVASGEGKEIQDEIRKIIDKAQELERTLLTQRIQDSADDAIKFNIVFAILLLVIVLILIVVYSIVAENLKALKSSESENANKNWLLTGNSQLNEKLIGDQSIAQLANSTISFLCTYLKANIGAVYLLNDKENNLILNGKFAFSTAKDTKENFKLNEGLIGQAAWEQKQISLTDITENQIRITSSVLDAKPKNLLITPFLLEGKTIGVIEIGKLTDFNETEKEFINVSMNSIAISVNTVQQAEEKEKRAAELAIANKELAYQNDEKEKRAAELAIANKELAYQNDEKEKRAAELGIANKELAYQNDEKEKRAAELGIANKELAYQNDEKEKRAAELGIANKELAYQNEEKEKRASELGIANKELAYQNDEKEKRAVELSFANKELSNHDLKALC